MSPAPPLPPNPAAGSSRASSVGMGLKRLWQAKAVKKCRRSARLRSFALSHRTCDLTAGGGGYERTAPSHHQHGDVEMPACLPHPQRHATGCLAVFASVTNLPQRNRLNLITADAHCRSCSSMGSTTQPATSSTAAVAQGTSLGTRKSRGVRA